MSTSTTSTESKTDSQKTQMPTPSGYEKPETEEVKTEETETEKEVDAYGYETEVEKEPETEEKPEEKVEEETEVETKATGYGDDEKEEDDKEELAKDKDETPEDEKTDEQKEAETLEKEIDESLGKLPEALDKDRVKQFALDNKMTKEQVDNYIKLVNDDLAAQEAANKQFIKDQRKEWTNELKNDTEFGGENFVKNVDTVEKFLEKHMPNMKKVLTERGSMVPPYIMKDFLKLSKVLNPTTEFEGGEPPRVPEKETNFLDEMYQ